MAKSAGTAGRVGRRTSVETGVKQYLRLSSRNKGEPVYEQIARDISQWRSLEAQAVGEAALKDRGYRKIVVRDKNGKVYGIIAFNTSAGLRNRNDYTYVAWLAGEGGGGIQALAGVGRIAAELNQGIHLTSLEAARPFYKIIGFLGDNVMIMDAETVRKKFGRE